MLRFAKERDKSSKDIYKTKLIKDENGIVLTEDDKILDSWQGYFQKLIKRTHEKEDINNKKQYTAKKSVLLSNTYL